jgi:hypothetical protein
MDGIPTGAREKGLSWAVTPHLYLPHPTCLHHPASPLPSLLQPHPSAGPRLTSPLHHLVELALDV